MILLFSLAFSISPIGHAFAGGDLYLKVESFKWEEFYNDSKLLEESGLIYGLGASARSDITKPLTFKLKAELFGGSVDYDGQTQDGTPVKTDTDYFGFKLEGDCGYRFMIAEGFALEPFIGVGLRWWRRDIQSTDEAIGYEETWRSFYARLGMRGDHTLSNQLNIFADAGVKLPIYTENEADLSIVGLSKVTVEPGNEASAFAELGVQWAKFKAVVFYEGMRFSESDPDDTYGVFIQPKSEADMFGLNVGVSF